MARQVIVPLDQSHVAECAVPYARALARRMNAPLVLLSVVEPSGNLPEPPIEEDLPPIEEPPSGPAGVRYSASLPIGFNPGLPEFDESQIDELTEQLNETEQYLSYVGDSITDVHVEKMVVYGNPVDQIIRAGEAMNGIGEDSPVYVIASHGRSGLGRVLLGSVALKVAERATSPMLMIRALRSPVPSADEISLNRIMIALDGSDFSESVVEPARHVFGRDGTEIHLMTSVDMERSWVTGEPQEKDSEGRTARDNAEQYIAGIADRMKARGLTVTWDVVEGDPAERINSVAADVQADVIALATHGRSGLRRLAIGSVAEEVLHKSTRPMFLVRPESTHGVRD